MKAGTDIAQIGSLVGDPARANMLSALLGGTALTASELALEAGVTPSTASSHLARLAEGGLVRVASQGRHRYFALAGPDVPSMLEAIAGVAASAGPRRARPGPRDVAMREAGMCDDHLAGERGVALFDYLLRRGVIAVEDDEATLAAGCGRWFGQLGIDPDALRRSRRP